ncbi:MAG: DUF1566 domain-containing protein [Sphingobacteriaceae bacterium]|nr:DUF1566 domain-containing protein [Sphingobacteriaceae bacterium]
MKKLSYTVALIICSTSFLQAQTNVCSGQQVSLELPGTAIGNIQWQDSMPGGAWNNISGATTATYTFTPNQNGHYRALVTDQNCTNNSGEIALNLVSAPTTANAGSNITNASGTITLSANTPGVGTGLWTILSGTGGTLGNPSLPNSSFTGLSGGTYQLVWTISNPPCNASSDTLLIVYDAGPALPSIPCLGTTLFVHPTDNAGPTPWGCSGIVTGASSYTNGSLNTSTIAATCTGTPAAAICANLTAFGFSDWYLPAYDQLLCLRDSANSIGGFAAGGYWSSSENPTFTANAMMRTFPSGVSGVSSKSNSHRIRCVRQAL